VKNGRHIMHHRTIDEDEADDQSALRLRTRTDPMESGLAVMDVSWGMAGGHEKTAVTRG